VKRNHELDKNFDAYISAVEESQVKIVYLELLVVVDSKMSEFYGTGLTDYIHTLLFIVNEIQKSFYFFFLKIFKLLKTRLPKYSNIQQ
jgi:hypothetical protein